MPSSGRSAVDDDESSMAFSESVGGGLLGAIRWGAYGAIVATAGMLFSPIYRRLTAPFKIYLQMSFMVVGCWTGADQSLRDFEARMRHRKRLAKHEAWLRGVEDSQGVQRGDAR